MARNPPVSKEVRQFLSEVIAENGLNASVEAEYGPGAEVGEGYNSNTFTVTVNDGQTALNMFVKTHSGLTWHEHFDKMFSNERYFYQAIYPVYQQFLKEYGIKDGFRNAPRCYGAKGDMIALENLRAKKYVTFENQALMDEAHIELVMRTLAKFHAISYAFKDQKRELYDSFVKDLKPCVTDIYRTAGFDKVTSAYIKKLLSRLDPVRDEELVKASGNLEKILIEALFSVDDGANEYSVITQGDCWSNNILFLYEENEPKDIMLVDWQLLRHSSPVIDLGYFFYPMAVDTTIEKFHHFMRIYHEELSSGIRQLGSDPDVLYPFSQLEIEWKRFVKYGFAMSFIVIEGLLMDKDEIPNFNENPDVYKQGGSDTLSSMCATPPMRKEDEFIARVKTIFDHFVKYDFL